MTTALSRRVFLAAGSAAFAGLLAGCGGGGAVGTLGAPDAAGAADAPTSPLPPGADLYLASLRRDDFEQRLGTGWTMESANGERTELELVDVEDRAHEHPDAEASGFRPPFSVTFEGPDDRCCAEGQYDLSHPDLGHVTVFASYGGTVERETVLRTTERANVYALHFA